MFYVVLAEGSKIIAINELDISFYQLKLNSVFLTVIEAKRLTPRKLKRMLERVLQ